MSVARRRTWGCVFLLWALGPDPSVAAPERRVLVLWSAGPARDEFLAGLRQGLAPASLRVEAVAGAPVSGEGWNDVTHALTEDLAAGETACLVTGPDRNLEHLSLQMAVKGAVRVYLVDGSSVGTLATRIPGVTVLGLTGSRSRSERSLGLEVGQHIKIRESGRGSP